MAVKTNTREVANLWENIKNISGIAWIVPDTLLWLTETLENRIVIDSTTAKMFKNIHKWLDIEDKIRWLKENITNNKMARPTPMPTESNVADRELDIQTNDIDTLDNIDNSISIVQQKIIEIKEEINSNNDIKKQKWNQQNQQQQTDKAQASANNSVIKKDLSEYTRLNPLLKELQTYQSFRDNYENILESRRNEFDAVYQLSDKFDFDGQISSIASGQTPPKHLNNFDYKDSLSAISLETLFFSDTVDNTSYSICDANTGKEIEDIGGYEVTVWWKKVKVKWIKIENNELKINELEIEPIQDIKFPATIKLNVRGSASESWVYLDVFKPLTISLQSPEMDVTTRQTNYDRYNSNDSVNHRIEAEYNAKREERENELIWEMLRSNGNEWEVNKIYENKTLKSEFIKKIRGNDNVPFPMMDIDALKTEFRDEITTKKIPLQYLVKDNAFTDYLRQNIAKNVEEFLKKKVKKNIDADATLRDEVLTTFTDFQTNMANTLSDDPNVRTDFEQTINQTRSNKRKRRDNYMRFLIWKSDGMQNQSLELNDKNHTYNINLSCVTMNKLVAEIEVDGKKIPSFAWRNLNELMKSIVQSGRIESNKLAAHIAFGALKSMVKMIKANNMNIDVRNANGNIVETRMIDDKLSINEIDGTWRTVSKIFDEDHFKNLKDFNTLDIALWQLSKDFHRTMHFYNQDYKRATQYTRVNKLMKYDPRWMRGLRWLRKTWNWRSRNNLDFEFQSTAVTVWDKTANISFEKGKFTLSMWDKEYTSRNIWRLLKKNKEFDGMQMEIMWAINGKFIEMLRNNARVKNSNFWVYDKKLKRLYVLDASWSLNYVNWPTRNPISGRSKSRWFGKIKDKNMPNTMTPITDEAEIKQFWQNPILGGKMVKSMMRRLWGM